jgi:hypothetical protein
MFSGLQIIVKSRNLAVNTTAPIFTRLFLQITFKLPAFGHV